jgi:DNA-binding MarR family transcriptional regulator
MLAACDRGGGGDPATLTPSVVGGYCLDAAADHAYTSKVADFAHAARSISRDCTCLRVRQASRVLTRVYDEALRPLGVQSSQLTLLVAVAEFGESGASLGALADALVMDRTTLTRNVRPLEKSGWLRIARAPEDRRSRIALLTRSGERLIEAALPLWERAQKHVYQALGARDTEALRTELERLVAVI